MPKQTDLVVSLCATRADLHTQVHLNMLATQIARLAREQGVFAGVTVLPMAGEFSADDAAATTAALHRELSDGELDREPSQEEPGSSGQEPVKEPVAVPEDVLTRLAKRGIQITYRLIGNRKVACLVDRLPDETIEALSVAFAKFKRPLRVIVIGGWSGEVPAAILAGAPAGTQVYSVTPEAGSEHMTERILAGDLEELLQRLGVRSIDQLPHDGADADAIVIVADRLAIDSELEILLPHLAQDGVFVGLKQSDEMRSMGATVHERTGLWVLAGEKLRQILIARHHEELVGA